MKRDKQKNRVQRYAAVICLLLVFMTAGCFASASETWRTDLSDTSGAHLQRAKAVKTTEQDQAEKDGASMDDLYSMSSSGWAYGSQLYGNAAQVYNTLARITNMRSYTSNHTISIRLQNPYQFKSAAERLRAEDDLAKAVHAFIKDYGEYYWLNTFQGWLLSSEDDKQGYCSEIQLTPRDYYSGIRGELAQTDKELQKAIDAVKKVSGTYEKVRAAHDYVIKLIRYNSGSPYAEYGHTITGGLLDKYQHRGVCECYAKLFKLICNANNIPCILVTGGSSLDSIGNVISDHMWNYVQMDDGQWYLVDATWDDRETDVPDDTYFLAGSQTMGKYGTTVSGDHIPVGRFNDSVEYDPFVLPVLSETSYMEKHGIKVPVKEITLKDTELTLDVSQEKYVVVTGYYPAGADGGMNYRYRSSDTTVASVSSSGCVVGKKAGEAVITVSSGLDTNVKAVCTVTVQNHVFDNRTVMKEATVTATGKIMYTCKHGCGVTKTETLPKKKAYVKLNASSLPLQLKKSTTVLKIKSCDSTDSVSAWTSSNTKVAVVDRKTGRITAKKTGKATITVTMKSGVKARCVVTVQKSSVKTKKLSLSKKEITLKKGKTYKLNVVRTPITATDRLKFYTSKKSVATVNSGGTVKAKKKGTAVITVKSSGGKTAKIKVKVS